MEKDKAIVKFDSGDDLFVIENEKSNEKMATASFGVMESGALDIDYSVIGGFIKRINCVFSNKIYERDLNIVEPENIEQMRTAFYYEDEEPDRRTKDFEIDFNSKEMDIVFSLISTPKYFYRNDRFEVYYNENRDIIYIKVKNLTPEEYEFLRTKKYF